MVGKLIFKTKKLLSLLSFGVLFFVAIEIWLSHKKMDVLNPSDEKNMKADKNNLNVDITTSSLLKPSSQDSNDFPDYINNVKMKLKKIFDPGRVHSNNNVYNDYEDTIAQFDDTFRNRTDFKGGGTGENDDGNYGESEYGSPDTGKNNYDVVHEQNHIPCKINGDYVVHCLRDGNEVYVPFSFIKKYFEITGEIVLNKKGMEELMWKHSYAKVYEMSQMEGKGGRKKWVPKYKHDGVFMSFEHYRVEIRDRVKCISAIEGVPISKQWGAQGYFYPIQIAQFGLSHYSKMLIEPERKFFPLGTLTSDWSFASSNDEGLIKKAHLNVVANANSTDVEVCFNVSDNLSSKSFYYLNIPKNLSSSINMDFLTFEMKSLNNAYLTVVFKTKFGDKYMIHYISSEETLTIKENDIYYGIGSSTDWHRLTRDLKIDFQKSLPKKIRKKLSSRLFPLTLQRIELRGFGCVRNLQLSDQDHLSLFYHSANWIVKNQDSKGGWPIPVSRVLIKDAMSLDPGWYSAMAQGHAMSLLSRAFTQSGNPVYLRAAYQAINPFLMTSSNGGVLTYLFGQHPWYEEYPTTPPSFVLNGFMYALFGLYDLAKTFESFGITKASFVLRDGLSLESNSWSNEFKSNYYNPSTNVLNKHLTGELTHNQPKVNKLKGVLSYLIKDIDKQFHNTTESFHDSRLSSKNSENNTNQGALLGDISPKNLPDNNLLNPAESVHQDEQNEIPIGRLDNILKNREGTKTRKKRSQPTSVDQHSSSFLKTYFLPPEVKDVNTAKLLFDEGLKTLKLALPLFDSGSGSFYDLRHFTIPGCAPNRARWDYHSTHISQLLMALSIDEDPVGKDFFQKTINRWMSYMKGRRAPHN